MNSASELRRYYSALCRHYGPQNWWPGRSRFEVIVGAYLTQNTNWSNVEKALANLRRARAVSVKGIRTVPLAELEKLVRPAGYFRQKARRLKIFVEFLDARYGGSLTRMFRRPTGELRQELLALEGVGRETADSILLYAGGHEIFVVDAYTRRILERHGMATAKADYDQIQKIFETALAKVPDGLSVRGNGSPRHPASAASRFTRTPLAQRYNEMHALVVRVGNEHCRTLQRCDVCPLQKFLP